MWRSNCRVHGRNSCHLEGSIEAGVECVVVGIEAVVAHSESRRRELCEVREVKLEQREHPAVEPAVAADVGLSTLGRRSTSRGRAAQ